MPFGVYNNLSLFFFLLHSFGFSCQGALQQIIFPSSILCIPLLLVVTFSLSILSDLLLLFFISFLSLCFLFIHYRQVPMIRAVLFHLVCLDSKNSPQFAILVSSDFRLASSRIAGPACTLSFPLFLLLPLLPIILSFFFIFCFLPFFLFPSLCSPHTTSRSFSFYPSLFIASFLSFSFLLSVTHFFNFLSSRHYFPLCVSLLLWPNFPSSFI